MYFLQPHWVPATWRSRAQTSIRAELPSGNVPTTRVLRRLPCDRALRARRTGERCHRRDGDGRCARARVPGALCRDLRRDVGLLRPAVLCLRRLGKQALRVRCLGAPRGHDGGARSAGQVPDDLEHAGRLLAVLADGARCVPGGRRAGCGRAADHAPARAQPALAGAVYRRR